MREFSFMVRLVFVAVLAVVVPMSAQGQTTATVSGNLKDLGTSNITSSRTYVRFKLINYGSNIPKVSGTTLLPTDHLDLKPNGSGVISGTVYRTDAITPSGVMYRVCLFDDGRQFRCADYTITASTFNLNSATPVTTTAVATAPTGDTTYQRLDGGNNASGNYVPAASGQDLGAAGATWDVYANLTQNSVAFVGASGLLSEDNTNFCWDDTNDRLGLLTCSPGSALQIGSTTADADAVMIFGKTVATSESNLPRIHAGKAYTASAASDLLIGATSGTAGIGFFTGNNLTSVPLGNSSNALRLFINTAGKIVFSDGAGALDESATVYRSAASTVKTDGSLVVAGTVNSAADDEVLVSNGTTLQNKAIADCNTNTGDAVQYDTATNAFSCSTHTALYALQSGADTINPADSTTYYFGGLPLAPTTAATLHRILVPIAGTVTRFDLFVIVNGAAGTAAANSTYSLRLNDTTDFCSITVDHDASIQTSNTCSQAVSAGDYLVIKWETPAWATNPTSVFHVASIKVE